MKLNTIIYLVFFIPFSYINAQNSTVSETEKNLIGRWKYIKLVDSNNKKVHVEYKLSKHPDTEYNLIFPDIEFTKNKQFIIQIEKKPYSNTTNWNLISETKIELIEILIKDSKRTEYYFRNYSNRIEELDANGNYIMRDTIKFEWVNKSKIKTYLNGFHYRMYKKK